MKKILFLLLPVCFVACQKKIASTSQSNPLITQAQAFFNGVLSQNLPPVSANFRANQVRVPVWDQAVVKNLSVGLTVEVPIHFEKKLYITTALSGSYILDISQLTKLVLFRDSLGFHYQVLTFIPDSNSIVHPATFTGFLLSEDWSGNSLASPERVNQSLTASGTTSRSVIADATSITACTEIDGYNYPADDPDDGYAWSESTCTTYSFDAESGGGYSGFTGADDSELGGGSGSAAAVTIQIVPPNNIITSISNYFSCFTNVGGSDHNYSVSVCVDQPQPGSRTPWVLQNATDASADGNPVNIGHTFLILTESYGTTVITRNIGFYPATKVYPFSQSTETAAGVYNNDQSHEYNISGTMNLTNAQFFQILNYCEDNSAMSYNLNTNNCTTFVLNAVAQTGINLPRTTGSWIGGSGDDPGDLGEDIRTGNIPGMTVNTSPASNHMNVGTCYP
jgi:hypothetical protein